MPELPDRARGLRVATFVAAAVVLVGGVLRWLDPATRDITLSSMRLLFAAAAVCVAGLAIRRGPSVAWIAAISAAGLGSIEVVAVARAWPDARGAPESWPWIVALAEGALVVAGSLAVAYAVRRRPSILAPTASVVRWLGILAVAACVIGAALTVALALTNPMPTGPAAVVNDLAPLRLSARVGLLVLLGGLLVGAAQDFVGPFGRARRRWAALGGTGLDHSLPAFGRLLADELLPGNARRREALVEAERARIAADLHAMVLPDLRRAAAVAASADAAPGLAANLQRTLEDVEQLMHGRQSIVLEEFGIVAALEWLAERTESRGALRVELDLDGSESDAASIPLDVSRVAFRVALLALDNVVRHAGANVATLRLRTSADALELAISDDGRGLAAAPPRPRGGRGLADMVDAAGAVGAALRIDGHHGTSVELTWRREALAGEHRTQRRDAADRPAGAAG